MVHRFHTMLLKDLTVNTIVMTRLKDEIDIIKNKLQKMINNHFTDEICLNLKDDLKFVVIILP
jgi:hypothetical protein